MEKDAISAGVSKIGGLFSTADVRILICYILSSFDEPVPGNMLCEILHSEGIANTFEVSDSLAFLIENGHIKELEKNGELVITESGLDVAKTLNTSISSVVKDRAYTAVLKAMIKLKNAKETDFEISKEDGRVFLTCSALDQGKPFMSIKLLLGDEEQAVFVKKKFLENTSEVFSKIYEILTKNDK